MSDGVNAVLGLIILASGLAFVGGLIGAVFLKGRRKKALGVSGVAFVVFVACVVIAPPLSPEDEAARAVGFRNAEEMSEAESHGISTAEEWDERKQAIEQEQERQEAARKEAEREAEEAAKREADRLAREAEAQAEAEDRRKGFHCLSQWDGAHTEFKRFVKSQMRNPRHACGRRWPAHADDAVPCRKRFRRYECQLCARHLFQRHLRFPASLAGIIAPRPTLRPPPNSQAAARRQSPATGRDATARPLSDARSNAVASAWPS